MKLSKITKQYIELKQSLGSKFKSDAIMLKAFSIAMGDIDITDVRACEVLKYISGSGPVTRFWHRKYGTLNGFYRFAIGRGYIMYSPLPKTQPSLPISFIPYIYSNDELRRLLKAAQQFGTSRTKLQSSTIYTLIILLYGAGLRVGEAISLNIEDVNLTEGFIIINESKFYKTRLLPLGDQLTNILKDYAKNKKNDNRLTFFTTKHNGPVKRSTVEKAFCHIRKAANVFRNDGARYQPRLHDLRHTFAVHRLVSWYRQGDNVQQLLPLLATYLGHINITSTQTYLTMTSDLLQEANIKFEKYAYTKGGNS